MLARNQLPLALPVVAALIAGGLATAQPAQASNISTTIIASADTTIDQDAVSANYATRTYFTARNGRQAGLVRFDATVATGRKITGATLKLNSGNVGGSAVSVYSTSNSWPENVAWGAAPARGTSRGTSGSYAPHQWVSWNVDAVVPEAGGTVSFRVENYTDTWMGLMTRESGGTAPQLVLDTEAIVTPPPLTNSPSGIDKPVGDLANWRQTYSDDFSGTTLGSGWGAYNGPISSMPGGQWKASHVKVGGDKVTLQSYLENGVWTTGGIMNNVGGRGTYGKYVVRMRMDKAMGVKYTALLWPASGIWPGDGEVDFAEDAGGNRTSTTATLIYTTNGSDSPKIQRFLGSDFSQWHTLGVEWSPNKLVYTIDDQPWATVDSTHVPDTTMNLAIQTEAGSCSQWMTCADATTPAVVNLDIDWVAVYTAK